MMLDALSNTGAYADLWSQLKSMDYALERTLTADPDSEITDLDRERLRALATFLRQGLSQPSESRRPSEDDLRLSVLSSPICLAALDLKERLRDLPELGSWHAKTKMGLERKLERLIDAIQGYLDSTAEKLFLKSPPEDEFHLLRRVLSTLLRDAELSLHR